MMAHTVTAPLLAMPAVTVATIAIPIVGWPGWRHTAVPTPPAAYAHLLLASGLRLLTVDSQPIIVKETKN